MGVTFLNHKIRTKVFPDENFDRLLLRVRIPKLQLTVILAYIHAWHWGKLHNRFKTCRYKSGDIKIVRYWFKAKQRTDRLRLN